MFTGSLIQELLSKGEGNETPRRAIEAATGLNGRTIRNIIQSLRLSGVPVLSNQRGYYLAETQDEKHRFVTSMRHRAREINRAASAVERGTSDNLTTYGG